LASLQVQIQQDESQKLYPRLVLYSALSKFKDSHRRRTESGNATINARRDFLDSFAYLCDVQKGGKTVTAAAIQELPFSNFLWLAANEGIGNTMLDYAQTMLKVLLGATPDDQRARQDAIFGLAVKNCKHRIQFYREEILRYAKSCRAALGHTDSSRVSL
jgi:hypothetical protein